MSRIQDLKIKLPRKQRTILLAILVVAVLAILAGAVFRTQISDLLRRATYSESDSGFAHNGQSNSLFLGMNRNLLVCTKSQIQLFSPSGDARIKESVSMDSPALNSSGQYAVIYDVGGKELRVIHGTKVTFSLTLPEGSVFLCATVNADGWLAATTKEDGYKGVVTVYNTSFETVLCIRLSSRYISDAMVTPDSRGVYLISPGQSQGSFENRLLYYTFSSKDSPVEEISLGSNVVLSAKVGDNCWILGDQSLMVLNSSATITAQYDYDGQYLKLGSLAGNGFATLLLSNSTSLNVGTLVTVNSDGELIQQLDIPDQALAVAVQNKAISVLTTSEILTTTRDLKTYQVSPNKLGFRNIAVYADGSTALVSSSNVKLYYPSGDVLQNEATIKEAAPAEAETPNPTQTEAGPAATEAAGEEATP